MRKRLSAAALGAALVLATACGSDGSTEADPNEHIEIRDERDQGGGPYGVIAVDNHFHDIHPEDEIEIRASRGFYVRNEGSNLHNFTIVGADISEDLKPGETFRFKRIGDALELGSYQVVCHFHENLGMTGSFSVVEGG